MKELIEKRCNHTEMFTYLRLRLRKKVKGRKRHIAVDIPGNFLHVGVHAANLSETKKGCEVFERTAEEYPSIEAFSADGACCGTSVNFVENVLGLKLEISKGIKGAFVIIKKRWIVERTFGWLAHFRRLSKDFEILTATAENMIRVAMIQITLAKCV